MVHHYRKINRLQNFDYSSNGAYFITICSKNRLNIFSEISYDGSVSLSKIGYIIDKELSDITPIYKNVFIDKYVIMPNHIHLILRLDNTIDEDTPKISRIIQQFKGTVTKQSGAPVWEKGFYDHIIRNQSDFDTKWNYIDMNPLKWSDDEFYI